MIIQGKKLLCKKIKQFSKVIDCVCCIIPNLVLSENVDAVPATLASS